MAQGSARPIPWGRGMARINIDDELHADIRFKRLVRKLGNEDQAIGMLYRFWRLAQDYWGDECGLMPIAEFEAEDFRPLAEVGFAEIRDDGYYAAGAEERFAWYLQKCRASKAAVKARSGKPKDDAVPPEPPARSTGVTPPNNPTVSASVTSTVTAIATAPLSDEVRKAKAGWGECLKKHGADRDVFPWEEIELARQIQARGDEAVSLAILGQKYEPASEQFKPSRHLSLKRLFDPLKFDRFVNLGAQARKKLAARDEEYALAHLPDDPPIDPQTVRKMIDSALGVVPKESA